MFVGRAARQADTTIKTIRYYERIGLIPVAARNGRFRVYDEETVERVRFIRKAQALGFSLEEIREIVLVYDQGRCSCGQVRLSVEAKLRIIESKQDELEALKRQLLSIQDRLPSSSARRSPRICPVIHAS
jgi:DNA-binding transcriptional MerR regulator